MKYYPWLHKLKQQFKELKNWHLIRNIQKNAPDIIQKRRFLKIYPCKLENGYNAREESRRPITVYNTIDCLFRFLLV